MKAFRAKPGYYCEGLFMKNNKKLYVENSKIALFNCYSD